MRIQLLSDLHNEIHRSYRQCCPDIEATDADLIVLAGDIDTGEHGIAWAAEQSDKLGRPIVYVAGNHEHYGQVIEESFERMRRIALARGVHLLENDRLDIDGMRILGCTLWTDFALMDDVAGAMEAAERGMNDYQVIRTQRDGGRVLEAQDTLDWHRKSVAWLTGELSQPFDGKTIVVTHHAPSKVGQHARHPMSAISCGFVSDLPGLLKHNIDCWMFGHTHSSLDTLVDRVRLVSNQRGYPGEQIPNGYDPALIVEV